jgi:hypothetical protein
MTGGIYASQRYVDANYTVNLARGRSENITAAQLNEITRLIGVASMGMTLVPFMEGVLEKTMPELGDNPTETIMGFIGELSFSEAALVIQVLNKAVSDGDALRRRRTGKRTRRPVAHRRSQAGSTRSVPDDNGVVHIGSNGRNGWRGDPR